MKSCRCPIWGTPARRSPRNASANNFISLRGGGQFSMTGTVQEILKESDSAVKIKLTTWIFDQNRAGIDYPIVDSGLLQRVAKAPPPPVEERLASLLRTFRENYPLIGQHGPSVADIFYAASASRKWGELRALWMFARKQGYAGFENPLPSAETTEGAEMLPRLWLTLEGHAWLEGLDGVNAESDQGFVAMWFDASMDAIYTNGFARAIEAAGYRPMRIDQGDFAGKIDDEVIAQIRRSRFMVADLTSGLHKGEIIPRGSVYYEAGFAEGLGIPVLYTRREGMEAAVHFDLRQHNFLVWSDPDDLRDRLAKRISAVLGDGPHQTG